MNKFSKKDNYKDQLVRKTLPMPVTCDCCGFELPDYADKNEGFFVTQMTCSDMNRNNKKITSSPSIFLKIGRIGNTDKILGDSAGGYHLKDNFTFIRWVVWCIRCQTNKSRLQDMTTKTNHMKPDGKNKATINDAVKKLNQLHAKTQY